MKGLPESFLSHLTVKFFATATLDPEAIARRVDSRIHLSWDATDFEWDTKIWNGHDEETYFVLRMIKFPESMRFHHNIFDIIKDLYNPWVPHITVPKAFFFMVEDQGFTPRECELKFGEIELCLGGDNV